MAVGLLYGAGMGSAWAQSGRDEAQRLLDERRLRQQEEGVARPTPEISMPQVPSSVSDSRLAPSEIEEIGPTFPITEIVLVGDSLLSDAEKRELTAPFVGESLGPKRIDLLLRRITKAYLDRGYVTTRAYLGPQNLASGRLEITVVTGRIERIVIDGKPESATLEPVRPVVGGQALRMADLEQTVEQINRLRSRRAEASIQPGQTAGGSILSIDTHPGKPWRASLGADNYGLGATGIRRQRWGAEVDNVLGLWDSWAVIQVESANARSELLSVSVPVGYGTASYTYAHATSRVELFSAIVSRTETSSHTYGWNHVIARNQSSRQAVDITLVQRDTRRHLDDFAVTPQQQSILRLAANHLWRGRQGAFSGEIGYSNGLKRFGGDGDFPNLPASAPHNQFEKWDANFLFAWNITPALGWRTQVSGQSTRTGLPGAEQIYLGGVGSIRGFREGIVSGDHGVMARNELQWNTAVPRPWMADGWRLSPYAFFDVGMARLIAGSDEQRLASLGLGLRAGWKDLSADFIWGRPQMAPSGVSRHDYLNFALALQY